MSKTKKALMTGCLLQLAGTVLAVLGGLSLAGFLFSGQLFSSLGAGVFTGAVTVAGVWAAVHGRRRRKGLDRHGKQTKKEPTAVAECVGEAVVCTACGAPANAALGRCEYCGGELRTPAVQGKVNGAVLAESDTLRFQ